jgi:hypothetical protein
MAQYVVSTLHNMALIVLRKRMYNITIPFIVMVEKS